MLAVNPGEIALWLQAQQPLAGYAGVGKARDQLQQAAPLKRLAAAFFHYRRNWLKETHWSMLDHAAENIRGRRPQAHRKIK